MEKLTAAQQQSVKKMSEEHLRLKLVAAGYEEDVKGEGDHVVHLC